MAKDPVCGMEVDPSRAAATAEYQGITYYFCAPGCKAAFEREPEKYVPAAKKDEQRHSGQGHRGHH
jgi:Cu+-exporting ATPase